MHGGQFERGSTQGIPATFALPPVYILRDGKHVIVKTSDSITAAIEAQSKEGDLLKTELDRAGPQT